MFVESRHAAFCGNVLLKHGELDRRCASAKPHLNAVRVQFRIFLLHVVHNEMLPMCLFVSTIVCHSSVYQVLRLTPVQFVALFDVVIACDDLWQDLLVSNAVTNVVPATPRRTTCQ